MRNVVALMIMSMSLVPFVVIYVIGALLSLSRWRSFPSAARLSFLAFVGFLFRVVVAVARNWLTLQRSELGWDPETFARNIGIVGAFDQLVGVVAWILLLIAFYRRYEPPAFQGAE